MNQNPLKIAMLGHKRIPSREGGVEVVVEQLATRMAREHHQVTCFNRRGRHVSGEAVEPKLCRYHNGVIVRSVLTIDKKGLAAASASFFAACRAAFGSYDVVHFHAEGPCAMLWLPKLRGKTCVATIHGLDWQREKWKGSFAARYIHFGEKVAARLADEIIVLSQPMQDYFARTYGRQTVWIPNGVSRPQHRQAQVIREKFGLEKETYILFLGRLVPEKGIQLLLRAFREVDTRKKLVIAGGASDSREFVQQMHRLGAADERVLFTGFVQGPALQELYSNAYVYVLPSQLEGMPLSLLEAMSYGNCCLTSDIAECTQVVQDKAVTFRSGCQRDLVQKLQMLCDNADLVAGYKAQAADFVCEKFSWENTTRQTLELYRKGGTHYAGFAHQ